MLPVEACACLIRDRSVNTTGHGHVAKKEPSDFDVPKKKATASALYGEALGAAASAYTPDMGYGSFPVYSDLPGMGMPYGAYPPYPGYGPPPDMEGRRKKGKKRDTTSSSDRDHRRDPRHAR